MLENLVRATIRNENLDINYDGFTAENHFGVDYTVSIEKSESCMELSHVNYFKRQIVLKTPCNESIEEGHYLAQMLAHELGHSETYPATNLLFAIIGTVGFMHAIKEKSFKTFFYTCTTLASYKLVVEEAIAEAAASYFHGTTYLDYNGDIKSIINFGRSLIDLL